MAVEKCLGHHLAKCFLRRGAMGGVCIVIRQIERGPQVMKRRAIRVRQVPVGGEIRGSDSVDLG
jgi:hypothetical protein